MEAQMENCAEEMMQTPNVIGVLCADSEALPLCYRGTLHSSAAAVVSQLLSLASTLDSESSLSPPVITLQSAKSKLVVTKEGAVTVAVHKALQ
uniref:Late endosomal/lysosomal adaptor and MAPK and MTOR activator 5 n=1 Tax=Ascaris lumbricoides TaxID=6252 RepID=A0A0M3IM47_ASCLU